MPVFKTTITEQSSPPKEWIIEYYFTPATMGIRDFKPAEIRILSAKYKLVTKGVLSMEMMPYLFLQQREEFITHCNNEHMAMLKKQEDATEARVSKLHDDAVAIWNKQNAPHLTAAEVKENYEDQPKSFPSLTQQMHEGSMLELDAVEDVDNWYFQM